MGYEHSKLGSPISDVVQPKYIVSKVFQQPAYAVSDDGRPQVPDVHFLGDVGARKINYDFLFLDTRGRHLTSFQQNSQRRSGELSFQKYIDESSPCDFQFFNQRTRLYFGYYFIGYIPRRDFSS